MTTAPAPDPLHHLSSHHRLTHQAIFRHPPSHNLQWHDLRSYLAAVAVVTDSGGGVIEVARNGHTVRLHEPKHKDAPTETVRDIRRFLDASESASAAPTTTGTDIVVVIDHQEAKVYHVESHAAAPQKLVPYDPHGHGRHLHSAHEWTDGKRPPERKSYYEAVAKTLSGAGRIVLIGGGTGRSSAMEQLTSDLKDHHPGVAARVVAAVVLDIHHTTEHQLLAKARELFTTADALATSTRHV